jgi:hypothetical protein
VTWQTPDGDGYGVFARRYASSGVAAGTEFRVNSYTTGGQTRPQPTLAAAGDFAVVWRDDNGLDGDGLGIFVQRFDSAGAALGTEFRANTYTTSFQSRPSIAGDGTGAFVVTWQSFGQDGNQYGVFGQRFTSAGMPAGTEFQANTYTTGQQSIELPAVSVDRSGALVVVWSSDVVGSDPIRGTSRSASRPTAPGTAPSSA